MYLLDTNVISELRKASSGRADKQVLAWAGGISASSLFVSVISILEIEIGILRLERKDSEQAAIIRSWLETHVLPAFSNCVLPLDIAVMRQCAKLHVPDPSSDRDAFIAATALTHGMTVVTKNTIDFENTGAELINPWMALVEE
jgi:hypothetical protein